MAEQQRQDIRERVLTTIEAEHVRFINLEFTDVVGMAKCVTIPVEQFPDSITQGKWFDGSSIEAFARVAESDMYLYPDLTTFSILPGKVRPVASLLDQLVSDEDDVVARVICDVYTPDGERFDGDPRATLARALEVGRRWVSRLWLRPNWNFSSCARKTRCLRPCPTIAAAISTSQPTSRLLCAARWSCVATNEHSHRCQPS